MAAVAIVSALDWVLANVGLLNIPDVWQPIVYPILTGVIMAAGKWVRETWGWQLTP